MFLAQSVYSITEIAFAYFLDECQASPLTESSSKLLQLPQLLQFRELLQPKVYLESIASSSTEFWAEIARPTRVEEMVLLEALLLLGC
jgi:hypothetical protein